MRKIGHAITDVERLMDRIKIIRYYVSSAIDLMTSVSHIDNWVRRIAFVEEKKNEKNESGSLT